MTYTPADVLGLISALGTLEIKTQRARRALMQIDDERMRDDRGYYSEAEINSILDGAALACSGAYADSENAERRSAAVLKPLTAKEKQ